MNKELTSSILVSSGIYEIVIYFLLSYHAFLISIQTRLTTAATMNMYIFQKIPILSIGGNCLKDVRKTCSIIMTLELTEVFSFYLFT